MRYPLTAPPAPAGAAQARTTTKAVFIGMNDGPTGGLEAALIGQGQAAGRRVRHRR